jgi:hypothetical protein
MASAVVRKNTRSKAGTYGGEDVTGENECGEEPTMVRELVAGLWSHGHVDNMEWGTWIGGFDAQER